MGWDVEELYEDEDPNSTLFEYLTINAQYSLKLFHILPDKVEGMNGIWMGKEFAGLMDIMVLLEISDMKRVFELLLILIEEYSKFTSDEREKNKT